MPKDIRSYFSAPAKPKEKPKPINLSDDDEIPESPDVHIKTKKKESRKKRVLSDSSDEDIFTSKKKKTTEVATKSNSKSKKIESKEKLKEVKASDIFGGGPIKRTEPLVKKDKKKPKTEIGIHSDDEFEQSLLELDEVTTKSNGDDKINGQDTDKHIDNVTKTDIKSNFFNKTSSTKEENLPDIVISDVKDKENKLSRFKIPKKTTDNDNASSSPNKKPMTSKRRSKTPESIKPEIQTRSKSKTPDKRKSPKDKVEVKEKPILNLEKAKSEIQTRSKSKTPDKRKSPKDKVEVKEKPILNLEKAKSEIQTRSKSKTPDKRKSLKDKVEVREKPVLNLEKSKSENQMRSKSKSPDKRKSLKDKVEVREKPVLNLEKSKSENQTRSKSKTPDKKKSPKDKVKVIDKPVSNLEKKLSMNKDGERKRDFSEFLSDSIDEGSCGNNVGDEMEGSKRKKKKMDKSLNDSVLSDEERHERKMHSSMLYQQYLNRSGPKHLGAKEIPEGTPTCLSECSFVVTGVLESFEREEICEAISKFGGCVKGQPSRKVTHVLAGEDAGPAKLAKAEELGIKIINEDQFLQMIIDLSKKQSGADRSRSSKEETNKSRDKSKESEKSKTESIKSKNEPIKSKNEPIKSKNESIKPKNETKKSKTNIATPEQMKSLEERIKSSFYGKSKVKEIDTSEDKMIKEDEMSKEDITEVIELQEEGKAETKSSSGSVSSFKDVSNSSQLMWVEKYRPQNLKQIIGQHGDKSNVKKLVSWLSNWYGKRKQKLVKPSPWSKSDDGGYFKAVLLSGPPGVGKTTTVGLVCAELGFDVVELNASDSRNKSLIRDQIGELLNSNSLAGYARGVTGKQAVSKKHVLVMDEVDGMAGNEDRGGLQELISLIKNTSVPIVCMCNDRNSDKMRTLVNYCYDLKFTRPRVNQIKSAMMSICCKEGLKIPPEALTQLIVASNQDVRQTLTRLSLWAADPTLNNAESLKRDAGNSKKDFKLGPWEAVRKVFSAEDHKTMTLNDKSDLFFYDYNISPLFVQETYLSVVPHCPKDEILSRISEAADSISAGDLVETRVRRYQNWNLLPMQAMLSSVIPGSVMSGHIGGQIQFPGWLGKNSRQNKMHRLAQTIHAHTRLSATGSKSSIFLDYAKHLRDAIVTPLVVDRSEGVERSVQVMSEYHLLREDLDSLLELALWPGQRDPMIMVDSKVKAAMTRAYNKQAPALPYSVSSFSKGRGQVKDDDEDFIDDGEVQELGSEDELPENDQNIKVTKKKSTTKSKEKDVEKPSGSKGKKGKGKK